MKMNGKQALLVQLARRGLLLTALFSMVLGLANISRAQSSATPASPEAIPARSLTKDVRGASSTSAPITEVGDGQKAKADGIKVHGHWKIDVRDPDGKLVSQTEFENALTTNDPNAASGDFALAALLSSVNTFVLVLANGLNNTNVTSGESLLYGAQRVDSSRSADSDVAFSYGSLFRHRSGHCSCPHH